MLLKLAKFFTIIFLLGCSSTRGLEYFMIKKSSFDHLDRWPKNDSFQAFNAFKNSCKVIIRMNHSYEASHIRRLEHRIIDWQPVCKKALKNPVFNDRTARNFFESNFHVYAIHDLKNDRYGKFTGYYEVELNGNLKPTRKFKYPIYKAPKNLANSQSHPSFTHAAINKGALNSKKLEIVWVDNISDLYQLHVQGAGVVKLQDGKTLKLSYANNNGFKFKSIRKALNKYAKKNFSSFYESLEWIANHPKIGRKILESNPSFVFFKKNTGPTPIGAHTVPLRSEGSLAIDGKIYHLGMPVWLEIKTPSKIYGDNHYHKLLIAQDTGGSIKGALRGDIFFGRGHKAALKAMHMHHRGNMFILLPKNIIPPSKVYIS